MAKKFPDGLKHFPFQMALDSFNRWPKKAIWKVFRWPGIFTVGLDSFQMAWNFCGWPRKFSDGLDSFQIAWTDSACLESFQMAWNVNRYMAGKVSRWSGTFPGFMDSFLSTWPGMFSDGLFPKIFQVHKNFPGSTASLLSWFFPPLIFTMKGFNNGWNQNLELKIVVLILRSDHSFWYGCIFRHASVSGTHVRLSVRPSVEFPFYQRLCLLNVKSLKKADPNYLSNFFKPSVPGDLRVFRAFASLLPYKLLKK